MDGVRRCQYASDNQSFAGAIHNTYRDLTVMVRADVAFLMGQDTVLSKWWRWLRTTTKSNMEYHAVCEFSLLISYVPQQWVVNPSRDREKC